MAEKSPSGLGRGSRAKLAAHLNCKPATISQVLSGALDFNLEQALLVSEFIDHTHEEAQYFLLLVQHSRAGSEKIRSYFDSKFNDGALRSRIALK